MDTDDYRTQFSAKYDAIKAIGVQPSAPIVRVRDVLICPTMEVDESATKEFRTHPPIGVDPRPGLFDAPTEPVEVGRGVVIERIAKEDLELVMNACTPRGHYFAPIRQFGQRYSFVRNVDLEQWQQQHYRWDPDGVVSDALIMSRLIRDNGYSQQFAARVADFADGEQTVVYTLGAGGKDAYRLRRDRDWLDSTEGVELRNLLTAFWAGTETRPERVRRAIWRTEYATWMAWADVALPVIVGGLESLLKTEQHGSTRQFKTRVSKLATELGVEGITSELCGRMYGARSEWVHGTHVRLFATGQKVREAAEEDTHEGPDDESQWRAVTDIARMQDVLRRAVRRCIEDEDFAAIFAEDDRIRERWPL